MVVTKLRVQPPGISESRGSCMHSRALEGGTSREDGSSCMNNSADRADSMTCCALIIHSCDLAWGSEVLSPLAALQPFVTTVGRDRSAIGAHLGITSEMLSPPGALPPSCGVGGPECPLYKRGGGKAGSFLLLSFLGRFLAQLEIGLGVTLTEAAGSVGNNDTGNQQRSSSRRTP